MIKLSIKAKVTLWYTIFLLGVTSALLIYTFISTDHVVLETSKLNTEKIVKESLSKIEYKDGSIKVSGNLFYYNSGINILIYDTNGKIIEGHYAVDFLPNVPLKPGETQLIDSETDKWLMYDLKGNGDFIIRGISPIKLASETLSIALSTVVSALPIFIVISGFGGYLISRKAFLPIKKINETANGISSGNDLTKRINLENHNDEISTLAETFDNMFDRLEEAFEKEKQFTSDASHELRTPIAVILSQCDYALEQNNNPKETTNSLKVIHEQGRLMSSFISQLLTFTRADKGLLSKSFEEVNLSELTEIIIEELASISKEKNISLISNIEDNITLKGDQTLLTRMLINLITNGIKYTNENGYVKVKVIKEDNNAIITVSDNGIGISIEHIDKIWNRFYRVEKSRTRTSSNNVGLGLSMVKFIVEAHNGKAMVKSEVNKGSEFIIILPI